MSEQPTRRCCGTPPGADHLPSCLGLHAGRVTVSASAHVSIGDKAGYDQALLDQAHAEVTRVAKKYAGLDDGPALDQCLRDFARTLVPHAGRAPSVHPPRHYRGWFRGWGDGFLARQKMQP